MPSSTHAIPKANVGPLMRRILHLRALARDTYQCEVGATDVPVSPALGSSRARPHVVVCRRSRACCSVGAALRAVVAEYPERAGFVCVIGSSSPPPAAALRQASLDMLKRLGDRLAWVICVIEGDGLHAATTRSVLAAMSLLLNRSKPTVT